MTNQNAGAMGEASEHLFVLANHLAEVYAGIPTVRAILLAGSAGHGDSDNHSDIDLIVYHDAVPSEEQLRAAAIHVGAAEARFLAGSRAEGGWSEEYYLRGIQCQFAHATVARWERKMATVLEQFETKTTVQKAIDGLLHGVALHGADLIERWRDRARAYPDGLARAMVESYLQFFPIWHVQDWFAARDATLWFYQVLAESGYNILGVLAGLNRLYFAPFHFKRERQFIARMALAPDDLADRLNGLFSTGYGPAVEELERLVAETIALVETHRPEVDTSKVKRTLGQRRQQWRPT